VLLLLLTLACSDPGPSICNGSKQLCEQPVDEVAFAATHNAMSSAESEWYFPNQGDAIPTQLAKGIRGLNIDLHRNEDGVLVFCHSFCFLGEQDMVEGFTEIRDFLQDHPSEVLILTYEAHVSAEDAAGAMEEAGLGELAYAHPLGEPWPSLEALLDAGTPVLTFSGDAEGGPDWYMDQWTHWIDTPYGQSSLEEVEDYATSCVEERGEPDTASLFNVNHFMTAPLANAEDAAEMNTLERLRERVETCAEQTGRVPNQVLVDFADLGDVVAFVGELNGDG
jgi:hypothetical protein